MWNGRLLRKTDDLTDPRPVPPPPLPLITAPESTDPYYAVADQNKQWDFIKATGRSG